MRVLVIEDDQQLARNAGQALTRDQILDYVWSYEREVQPWSMSSHSCSPCCLAAAIGCSTPIATPPISRCNIKWHTSFFAQVRRCP